MAENNEVLSVNIEERNSKAGVRGEFWEEIGGDEYGADAVEACATTVWTLSLRSWLKFEVTPSTPMSIGEVLPTSPKCEFDSDLASEFDTDGSMGAPFAPTSVPLSREKSLKAVNSRQLGAALASVSSGANRLALMRPWFY